MAVLIEHSHGLPEDGKTGKTVAPQFEKAVAFERKHKTPMLAASATDVAGYRVSAD